MVRSKTRAALACGTLPIICIVVVLIVSLFDNDLNSDLNSGPVQSAPRDANETNQEIAILEGNNEPIRTAKPNIPAAAESTSTATRKPGFERLSGSIVYEDTGDPIPFVETIVSSLPYRSVSKQPNIRTNTDIFGRFDADMLQRPEKLRVRISEPSAEVDHFSDHAITAGEELKVTINCGPTYLLNLIAPKALDLESLRGTLTVDLPGGMRNRWQKIQSTPQPWIRFPASVRDRPSVFSSGTSYMIVKSVGGYWIGSALVSRVTGFRQELVEIVLREGGCVSGIVRDVSGKPIKDCELLIQPVDEQDEVERSPDEQLVSDQLGKFKCGPVAAGRYKITAMSPSYFPVEKNITIEAGTTHQVDIELGRGSEISGYFVSKFGVLGSVPRVRVRGLSQPKFEIATTPTPRSTSKDGIVADFHIRGLSPGQYEITLAGGGLAERGRRLKWTPASVVVSASAKDVVFEGITTSTIFDWGFRVFDKSTSKEISRFDVIDYTVPNQIFGKRSDRIGISVLEDAEFGRALGLGFTSENGSLRWMVIADGFAPAIGDARGFEPVGDDPRKLSRVRDVSLERGWGRLVQTFVESDSGVATARSGVEIFADSQSVGTTDAEGLLIVVVPTRPAKLTARLSGFHSAPLPPGSTKEYNMNSFTTRDAPFVKFLLKRN